MYRARIQDDSKRNARIEFLKDLENGKEQSFMWLDWKVFQHLRRLENPSVNKNSWHQIDSVAARRNVLSCP